jgi:serine phosphatase RsbU (regulator of sigma subunit)
MPQPGVNQSSETRPIFDAWETRQEKQLFLGSLAAAFVICLIVFGLELFNNPAGGWLILLRGGVALVVLTLTVGGDLLTLQDRIQQITWEKAALSCAALSCITGLFSGPEFNIMLGPLLMGLANRRSERALIIKLGLAGICFTAVELLLFYALGWSHAANNVGVTLAALAALTFSLAIFLKLYNSQVEKYQTDAATKASEMEVAHEIQTSLMPPNTITSGNWTLAARSIPAQDVGGDFYEYIYHPNLEKTISGIAIGDVAGKGIPAALQMAVVRTLFRVEARRRIFPAETLLSVNMALQAERSFGMVTMCYAFLDVDSNTMHLANAGHNYPLLLNETLQEIGLPGLPLGIDDSIEYEEVEVKIEPGSSVIFYTDGVPEAMDREGNLYTFERFRAAVQANRQLDPVEMVAKMLAEIDQFTQGAPQSDDITILVLQYHPQPGKIAPDDLIGEPSGLEVEVSR